MKRLLVSLKKFFEGNQLTVFVLVFAAIYFLYGYWMNYGRPGIYPYRGWYQEWHDQRVVLYSGKLARL